MSWLLIAGLTFAFGLVSARLYLQHTQRQALLRWLQAGGQGELPDGSGQWREIFTALQRHQKTTRQELADVSQRLERYLQATTALPDGVILIDAGNHIEWVNITATRHLGIDSLRDIGTLISQLVRQPVFFDYLSRFRDGVGDDGEIHVQSNDGQRTLSLQLLHFSTQGTLLISRDITDIVRTEKMRRDFVANVSHELRTPVTVIGGFLEQMTGEAPPTGAEAQRFLSLMADQATRMSRLVEDLLTLSRLESETRTGREAIVDVAAMVPGLVDEALALSAGRHSVAAGEVGAVKVLGCADELRSAFSNLLSNAIRYTPEGGSITLSWQLHGESAELAVTDTGIGIAPEHIPRLTERFYRVDRGRSASTGGTGLGLAIVKHVLSRHDAKLSIRSASGRGSTFSAVFPPGRLVGGAAAPSHGD